MQATAEPALGDALGPLLATSSVQGNELGLLLGEALMITLEMH
jgi:hypothetical protein